MTIPEILKITQTEKSSLKYLEGLRWSGKILCPKCGSSEVKTIDFEHKDSRYRCNWCRSRFTVFTDTYLTGCKIKASKLILAVKLYTLELPVSVINKELGLNYKTVLSLVDKIRQTVFNHTSDEKDRIGLIELQEAFSTGKYEDRKGKKPQTPVFGIREQNGKVSVEVVYNIGGLSSYEFLVVDGYNRIKVGTEGRVQTSLLEGFWTYAKDRLSQHRGVAPEKLPLYMKELEFRFNNISNNHVTRIILGYLLDYLPTKKRHQDIDKKA